MGDNANRTTGIKASGAATTVNMTAGTLELQGQGAIGVEVSEQGTVNLEGTAIPKFAADDSGITDQIAFRIIGDGATINTKVAQGTLLEASGQRSVLFRIEDGAKQTSSLLMQTSGTGSRGSGPPVKAVMYRRRPAVISGSGDWLRDCMSLAVQQRP